MWLGSRMSNLESLCKEFIDNEEKDDMMEAHSDNSDFEPTGGAQFGYNNNNTTSLTNINDTELNSQNLKKDNMKTNESFKFKMNKGND